MKQVKVTNWKNINWKNASVELKRLQAKLYEALITKASKNEIQRIHNEIVSSFAVRAMAVRKTVMNKGGKTSGIDKILWKTDAQRFKAIETLRQNWKKYEADKIRRVWIPKTDNSTEKRPLGIPTIKDRAIQTLWNFVLDVHQEHSANPRSFGFRIGRNAKQALNYAWMLSSGAGKRTLLKIDIRKAYDRTSHSWILANVPINTKVVKQWIKTGIIDKGIEQKPTEGVPQGGPISPTIFNFVLNGVEDEIMKVKGAFPIRFADDILVFGETMNQMEKVKELIIEFLKPRGLELNEGKTSIKTIEEGIDFLGYNIREYPDETRVGKKGKPTKKGILIVKPSKTKIENFKKTIKSILTKMRNHGAGKVIMKLNPIIRGWANYFNAGGGWTLAKENIGNYIFQNLLKWVKKKHRGKKSKMGLRKLVKMYFKGVQRRWGYYNKWTFFGKNDGNEVLIVDIQEIKVAQENQMKFDPSPNPYNPADKDIFDKARKRAIKQENLLSKLKHRLLVKQDGYCVKCGDIINLASEKVERHHIVPKAKGGKDTMKNTMLIHKTCHDKITAWERKWAAYKKKQTKS